MRNGARYRRLQLRKSILMWLGFIILIPGPIILVGSLVAMDTVKQRASCEARGGRYVTGRGVEVCLRKDIVL